MVSVQPSRASPDDIDVVISFRSASSDVVFLSADVTNWHPEQMAWNGESHEHVITVPRGTKQVLYKFRIGDSNWVHDGTVNAEPDGFFGWNNKFEIPEVPMPTPTNDFEDDTELESVAAVESVADTISECGTEDRQSIFHDEDLIDRDENEKKNIAQTQMQDQQETSEDVAINKSAVADAAPVDAKKKRSFRHLLPISAIGVLGVAILWVWGR